MPESWTGKLIGEMHNAKVTYDDMAEVMGCTKSYVSRLLNCSRTPKDARERCEGAFEAIMARRQKGG